MRAVIELKRGEVAEIVLNNLYKLTPMQETFGMNMVALVDGQPKLLNLKQFLDAFLRHRREVVTRRTVFDLRKARDRGHILEGLAVALSNVDEVIAIIKAAATPRSRAPSSWRAPGARRSWRRCSRALPPSSSAPSRCRRSSAFPPKAIACPTRRRSASSRCSCSASRAWSRTRSSPSTAR